MPGHPGCAARRLHRPAVLPLIGPGSTKWIAAAYETREELIAGPRTGFFRDDKEDDGVMNPSEDQYILHTHQARVDRVNRERWQFEPAELDPAPADARPTFGERTRRRLGTALIQAGERLLPVRPAPGLADCEPC